MISSPFLQVITVDFIDMAIEYHLNCIWDSLAIYDGPTSRSNRLADLCGNTLPPSIESSTNYLYFVFTSDAIIAKKGFKIKLTFVQGKFI